MNEIYNCCEGTWYLFNIKNETLEIIRWTKVPFHTNKISYKNRWFDNTGKVLKESEVGELVKDVKEWK